MNCLIISLKNTHPEDHIFTFWREDNAGFTFFIDQAARKNVSEFDIDDGQLLIFNGQSLRVPDIDISHLKTIVRYNGRLKSVLLNTPAVRKCIGITESVLKGGYKSRFIFRQEKPASNRRAHGVLSFK